MEKVDLRNAKLMGGIGAILPLVAGLFLETQRLCRYFFCCFNCSYLYVFERHFKKDKNT